MKEFLTREDDKTDPDKYWQDVYDKSYHGHDRFTARIFAAGIRELERVKCTKE